MALQKLNAQTLEGVLPTALKTSGFLKASDGTTAITIDDSTGDVTLAGDLNVVDITATGTVAGVTATNVGLGNVDNTTDANKPVSTATQTALDDKLAITTAGTTYAPLASPALTGTATGVNLTLSGNLTINGLVTTINSTTLTVDDKNIELGSVDTPSDTTADGGGITLKGATDKTFNWVDSTDAWTSSEHINLASGKTFQLNGTAISASAAELNLLDGVTSTTTELNYTNGVTSAIQTQMNAKAPLDSPTFTGDAVFDTSTLTVDSTNNRVGIGTTGPHHPLTLRYNEATEGGGLGIFNDAQSSNNSYTAIYFGSHSVASPHKKQGIGVLRRGDYGVGDMRFMVDSNADDADGTFASDTKMTILQNGNVGIGLTNPLQLLSLKSSIAGSADIFSIKADDDGYGLLMGKNATDDFHIELYDGSSAIKTKLRSNGDSYFNGGNVGIGTTAPGNHDLRIKQTLNTWEGGIRIDGTDDTYMSLYANTSNYGAIRVGDNSAYGNLVLLPDGGNVGIGVTDPDSKLEVNGNTHCGGNLGIGAAPTGNRLHVNGNINSTSDISDQHGNVRSLRVPVSYGFLKSLQMGLHFETNGTHGVKPKIQFDSGLSGTNYASKAEIVGGYDSVTGGAGGWLGFSTKNTSESLTTRMTIDSSGNILPGTNNSYSLGSTSLRWANIYTYDLNLSNEGKEGGNEVDGTTGDWTIQEGDENLFVINRKTGKKFKIKLEGV